jgi:putrescine aminotransferase
VEFVEFGDAAALAEPLGTRQFAGFLLEPLQGEAGFVSPPPGYLGAARRLCSESGTLLIADEIQTGLGRTGRTFAVDEEGVVPDCLLLGKALGAGAMPLSALLTTNELWRAGLGGTARSPFHASTYGGNTRACVAGLATLQVLEEEGIVAEAEETGAYLRQRLVDLASRQPLVRSVRGRGLMMGVELASPWTRPGRFGERIAASDVRYLFSAMVLQRLVRKHRMVTTMALLDPDVIRVQPPLNLGQALAARFVEGLEETLEFVGHHTQATARALPDIVRFCMPRLSIELFE